MFSQQITIYYNSIALEDVQKKINVCCRQKEAKETKTKKGKRLDPLNAIL